MTNGGREKAAEELRRTVSMIDDMVDTARQALSDAGEFSLDAPDVLDTLASLREAADDLGGAWEALDEALKPFEWGGAYELREDEAADED